MSALLIDKQTVLDVLLLAENAMLKARLEASKVDDANRDRCVAEKRKLFPCNKAIVFATETGLDAIRSFRMEVLE